MKKITVLSFLALLAFTVFACGGGGGGDGGMTGPSSTLQGTFVFQEATFTEGGSTNTLRPPDMTGTITFDGAGRFTAVVGGRLVPSESLAGSYSVNGLTVILDYDDGSRDEFNLSPDRNQLSMTFVDGATTITVIFVRA